MTLLRYWVHQLRVFLLPYLYYSFLYTDTDSLSAQEIYCSCTAIVGYLRIHSFKMVRISYLLYQTVAMYSVGGLLGNGGIINRVAQPRAD